MTSYRWQGIAANGKLVNGVLEAANDAALSLALAQRHVVPLTWVVEASPRRAWARGWQRGASPRALALLTRQLAVMTKAGLPLVRSLDALAQQHHGNPLASLLTDLRCRLEAGESLANAMRDHPRVFGRLYTAMVAAGEATGDMERVLSQLAAHLERNAALRKRLQSALLYPALVVIVATAVTGGLLVFVVPIFAELFQSFGQALPLPTRIVVAMSAMVTHAALPAAVAAALLLMGLHRLLQTPHWRRRCEHTLLRVPVLGKARRHVEIANQARVLSAVISAGVPLLEALRLGADASTSLVYQEELASISARVRGGEPLAHALAANGLFPSNVCQLVAIGESTGTLEGAWLKIAELYEDEVDHLLGNLTALIEPLFIATLGVIVGGILIALYLPIFQIGTLVQ